MERLGDDLRGELARLGPQGAIADLVEAWPAAVGEAIARAAWPARVQRDGALLVHTASAAWAFELGHLAPTILERLREAVGEACPPRLRFKVGPIPGDAAPPEEPAARRVAPTEQHRAAAEQLVAGIGDDSLRSVVARAAAASLARGADDRRVW